MLIRSFIRAARTEDVERDLCGRRFAPERCDAFTRWSGLGDCFGVPGEADGTRPVSMSDGGLYGAGGRPAKGFSGDAERPRLPSEPEAISIC